MEYQKEENDDTTILCQILYGHVIFEIGRTGIKLGVFDALTEGEVSCKRLAQKCNVPERNFVKFLDALCALKLLKKTEKGTYENTTVASKYLTSTSPQSLIDVVEGYYSRKGVAAKSIGNMKKASAMMKHEENIFDQYETNEEQLRDFHDLMASLAQTCSTLLKAIDLSQFKKLVDLGGSTGAIARKIADEYPKMEVISLDRPQTADLARSMPINQNTRVQFVAGDFFKGPLPEADIYTICHVLLDWQDEECEMILKTVCQSLKPGGAVLIMDFMLNDDRVGPLHANLTDVMHSCEYEGKQRSFSDFTTLLDRSGFGDFRIFRSSEFSFYDGILAKKV